MLSHFARSVSPISVTYAGYSQDTATRTVYTFTNVSIVGPGFIVVGVAAEGTGNSTPAPDITSITIGGSAASIVQETRTTSGAGGGPTIAALARQVVSDGTQTTVVVNFSATNGPLRCSIGVWRILGNKLSIQNKAAGSGAISGASTTATLQISEGSKGRQVVISMFSAGTNGLSGSYNILSTDINQDNNGLTRIVAGSTVTNLTNDTDVIVTLSGSSSQSISQAAASFF